MKPQTKSDLLNNSRFYIVAGSILLSITIVLLLQIAVPEGRLRGIRTQQAFGLAALLYWYIILIMAPISKLSARTPTMASVLFTRRAFGIIVAYFALLHAGVGFFGQLEGWHGISLLPFTFKVALLFGVTALASLLLMAVFSVDYIVRLTRFRWWKVLARINYIAGVLALVHVWMVGTHVAPELLQVIAFQALVILFGLEAWRIGKQLALAGKSKAKAILIPIGLVVALSGGLVAMRLYVPSYGETHTAHEETKEVLTHDHK